MNDFEVSNHGSIFLLTPITLSANEWVNKYLPDDIQRLRNGICVEHRYIEDIIDGIRNDGLTVA